MTSLQGWTPLPAIRNNTVVAASQPITNNAGTAPRANAAQLRICLPPEQVGARVMLSSKVELKVETPYDTLAAGFIRVTRDGQFINGDPNQGWLARPMGWNIKSPGSHYNVNHHIVDFVIPDTSVYYFCHVYYGASTAFGSAQYPGTDYQIYAQYVEQIATIWLPPVGDVGAEIDAAAARMDALEARIAALEAGPVAQ